MGSDVTMRGTRGLVTRVFYWSGALALGRALVSSRGRFILAFHGVSSYRREGLPPGLQPDLSVQDLRRILGWLVPRFPLLTPEEALDSYKPGVLLTFDDGFANNVHVALPVLEEFEAPAVFFVPTQHVVTPRDWLGFVREAVGGWWGDPAAVFPADASELYDGLSLEQLRKCAQHPLLTIGSHTVTHPFLTACSDEQVWAEASDSRSLLQEVTGIKVDLFAYPTGDYDRRVARIVESAGYRAAFVLGSRKLGLGRMEIERVGLYGAHPAYLSGKLSGLHIAPLAARPLASQPPGA